MLMCDSPGYSQRAAYYDIEFGYSGDRNFLTDLITGQVNSVLEIPCGSGRNLTFFADTGRSFTLVDRELSMVQRVFDKKKKARNSQKIRAFVGDMLSFTLRRAFDLILVPRDSFLLIHKIDASRALRNLKNHLHEGGTLMLDVGLLAHPGADGRADLPDCYDPSSTDGEVVREWTRPINTDSWLCRERQQYHSSDSVYFKFNYKILGKDLGLLDSYSSRMRLARYCAPSLFTLITNASLCLKAAFRNYRGDVFTPQSDRIILLLSH